MSYWARTVIVPLLVLAALKPVARTKFTKGVTVTAGATWKHAR